MGQKTPTTKPIYIYPLVICYITIEHGHRNTAFSHQKMVIVHNFVSFKLGKCSCSVENGGSFHSLGYRVDTQRLMIASPSWRASTAACTKGGKNSTGIDIPTSVSMDWLMGKSTGNHGFSHEIWGFPAIFPLSQPIYSSSAAPSGSKIPGDTVRYCEMVSEKNRHW